jgi:flagellar M-ring protein FliF
MSASQKVSFLLVIASVVILLVVVFIWSSKPDYVVLFSELSTQDAAKIHAKLAEMNVPYQLKGTMIEVPSKYVYETRLTLANEGLPKGAHIGYEIFDKTNLGQTDYLQRLNFQRALEGELARTISSLETIQSARVHLVIPRPTIFSEKEEKVTASIIVDTTGGMMSKQNILAITHLVSSSVEGLQPSDVTIIDNSGNLLSNAIEDNMAVSMTSSQLEAQKNIERYLENKVASLLTGVLGPGKSIVRVTAEVDYSQNEKTQETFNPESQVARSENRIEESTTNGQGSAGTAVEKTITNYEINKTVEHIIGATGKVSRISIAVVVDGTYKWQGEGAERSQVYVARTEEERDAIRKLVVSSMGITDTRGDLVEVINIPFDKSYLEEQQQELDKLQKKEQFKSVAQKAGPWAIVFVVFVALFVLLQKIISQAAITKVSISGASSAGSSATVARKGPRGEELYEQMREEEMRSMEQNEAEAMAERLLRQRMEEEVSTLASSNPDAVAKVIKEWLEEG